MKKKQELSGKEFREFSYFSEVETLALSEITHFLKLCFSSSHTFVLYHDAQYCMGIMFQEGIGVILC